MNFDLNIDNYGLDELKEMFELSNNYDKNMLDSREIVLKNSIVNNKNIDSQTKNKTLNFIVKAKNILIENITTNSNKNNKFQDTLLEFYNASYDLKKTNISDDSGHMVQDRKERPYLSSYPSEFFPGIINPLKKKTNRLFLNIDSRFRDNYYGTQSTNYYVSLPVQLNNIYTMQLSQIELPITFYVISKQLGNNFFTISANLVGNSPIFNVIEIPSGNYSQTNLISLLNTFMTNLGGIFANIVFGVNILNSDTGTEQTYVSINSAYAGPTIEFSLNFQANILGNDDKNTPLPLKFGWLLGFRNGIYINNSNYVSEGLINLVGPRYLFLVIDDFNNNVNNGFYSAFNNSVLNKNILARISVQSGIFTSLSENNLNLITYPRQYYGPVNILNMNIQLLDEYGRIIDLNNMDFSFCLTFQTAYDL
jgi:hypothetical protein